MNTELVRLIIHPLHEFCGFCNNRSAVTPGEYRSKKTCYFYVLGLIKTMGHGYWIKRNKTRLVEFLCFCVKELTKFFTCHRVFHNRFNQRTCYFPIAWSRSAIKSSTSSIPTLSRISESLKPFLILSSL